MTPFPYARLLLHRGISYICVHYYGVGSREHLTPAFVSRIEFIATKPDRGCARGLSMVAGQGLALLQYPPPGGAVDRSAIESVPQDPLPHWRTV